MKVSEGKKLVKAKSELRQKVIKGVKSVTS